MLNVEPEKINSSMEVVVNDNFKGSFLGVEYGLVGRVSDLEKLVKMKVWLNLIGQKKVGIKYMGGLWVLLVFQSSACMEEFLQVSEVWKVCFDSLQKWEGQTLPLERLAWVKVIGLPVCLYDRGILDEIGGKFGVLVHPAEVDENVNDLSYVLLGILCDRATRITDTVLVKWKGVSFQVLVEEVVGDWEPECLEDVGTVLGDEEITTVERGVEENVPSGPMKIVDEIARSVEEVAQVEKEVPRELNTGEGGNGSSLEVVSENKDGNRSGSCSMRKGYRKKGRSQKSPPSLGHDRPKKRAREGEDIFDLDRLIYAVNSEEARGIHGLAEQPNMNESLTPDMNGSKGDVPNTGSPDPNNIVLLETVETVNLGLELGVEELDKFNESVSKVIREEGFQLVDQ